MPRTKALNHYPPRYAEIVRECGIEGAVLRMPVETMAEARSIKGQWHAYMGSLRFAAGIIERRGPPFSSGDNDIMELATRGPTVMIQIEERTDGVSVLWQNRDSSWQAQRLRGIVREGTAPLLTSETSTMDRLMKVQADTDKGKDDGSNS